MGCGDCQGKIGRLEQRVVDLEAALDALKREYLALAEDYDQLAGSEDEDEDE